MKNLLTFAAAMVAFVVVVSLVVGYGCGKQDPVAMKPDEITAAASADNGPVIHWVYGDEHFKTIPKVDDAEVCAFGNISYKELQQKRAEKQALQNCDCSSPGWNFTFLCRCSKQKIQITGIPFCCSAFQGTCGVIIYCFGSCNTAYAGCSSGDVGS